MADVKEYKIVINGVQESIDAVENLKRVLGELEQKIDAIQNKATLKVDATVTTTTNTSNGGGRNNSGLEEQDALEKQILATEEKLAQVRDANYQKLIHMKNELKEYTQIAKSSAAAEENKQGLFDTNTMLGMKEQLKSIKTEMQTLDVNSDRFRELTQQANELNGKLKEIEQSYGQFGRNVGNYANGVADGLQQVVIKVGDAERTFASAKEASRELGNELKNMAVNGEQGTEAYKALQKAVSQLNSDMKDATVSSKSMDNLLDTMKGFASLGQVTQGFSALFGFDDSEIERSIQKLVALQNVMQGLEEINQQMNSGEGIGGWLAKGNEMIDNFAEKLLGAKTAQEGLNAANTAGKTAATGLAAAETAQAAATNAATVATKALSLALKTIGIGLVISLVATLVTYWKDIVKWFKDTIPALKNLTTWFDKIRAVASGVGNAILNYMVQPLVTFGKIVNDIIHGNFSKIGSDLVSGIKKTFNVAGNYQKGYHRETERQQKVHNDKMREQQKKANEETLKDEEAKYGKSHQRTQEYLKKQMALTKEGSDEYRSLQRRLWEDERQEKEENDRKNKTSAKKSGKDLAKSNLDIEKEIAKVRIDAMKEGLNKTISQLEEERKERLAKIRENGRDYKEAEAEINALYDKKIEDEIQNHTKEVEKMYDDMYKNIRQMEVDNARKQVEIAQNSSKAMAKIYQVTENNQNEKLIGKRSYQVNNIFSVENSEMLKSNKEYTDLVKEREILSNKVLELFYKRGNLKRKELEETKRVENNIKEWENLNLKNDENIAEARERLKKVELGELKDVTKEEIELEIEKYEKSKRINEQLIEDSENYLRTYKSQINEEKDELKANAQETSHQLDEKVKAINKYQEKLRSIYGEDKANEFIAGINAGYGLDDTSLFEQRISNLEAYWQERIRVTTVGAKGERDAELKLLKQTYSAETKDADDNYNQQLEGLSKWQEKKRDLIIAQAKQEGWTKEETNRELNELDAEYQRESTKLYENYSKQLNGLEILNGQKEAEINEKYKEQQKKVNSEFYRASLQEYRDFMTALNNKQNKAEVGGFLGIINISKTKQNYKEVLDGYNALANDIKLKRDQLNEDFKNGLIDEKTFDNTARELDRTSANIGESIEEIKEKMDLGNQIGKLISDINQYFQAVGQGLQQVLSQVWENQDAAFDKAMETLEKQIDEYDELLDKQREITEKHKDEVTSVEDELSTARGDRRQQLIDQLNAEMAAQRASLAQEKKIAKEKEKLEARKEKEEEKQKKREHKRAVTQAIISAALATANGYATAPFIPTGLAMGTLAAALGAVQVALIRSQKFADGGIIQGKSHSQGGVKILGGRAEVEGGEFITNKVTTSKNVELLEYINGKKKRINLDDLIEFYGGNSKVRKNIANVKTKFAQGGQVPTLRSDIGMNDNLTAAFQDYANRPTVVQVVDIVNKTDRLNRVKVMSGLVD